VVQQKQERIPWRFPTHSFKRIHPRERIRAVPQEYDVTEDELAELLEEQAQFKRDL
jgi:hypothetical protein